MSLFSLSTMAPDWYIVCLLNSKYISEYIEDFINNTQTFQINDARVLPIIIPNSNQLKVLKDIFNKAISIKKSFFNDEISEQIMETNLIDLQNKLDKEIFKIYKVDT